MSRNCILDWRGRWTLAACSLVALDSGAALAQDAAPNDEGQTAEKPPVADPEAGRQIVVIGNRTILAALKDTEIEQTYDSNRTASYAVSTIGELLDQIKAENGDADPTVLVNGRPAADAGEISDLPVEAIQRVETMPRGSAAKIGGATGQRAYNVVLKPSLKTITLTGSHQLATEGEWGNSKGEALFTLIKGRDRINLAARFGNSGVLLEADRSIVGFPESIPYSSVGNILAASGSEIDPALSALAGQTVTRVALTSGNTAPTLAQLAAGANRINPSNTASYRSLRGASRPVEVSLTGNKVLASWLELSLNARLGWTTGVSLSGLPAARFSVPAGHPNNPLSRPFILALNDPAQPLRNRSKSNSGSITATFNANLGEWRMATIARYDQRDFSYTSQYVPQIAGGTIALAAGTNPFAGTVGAQIPVSSRLSNSSNRNWGVSFDTDGPLFDLPAGKVRFRAGVAIGRTGYDGDDEFNGPRSLDRNEFSAKAGITIPLTGGKPGLLSELGETELNLDLGRTSYGRLGDVLRHAVVLNWRANSWLRLSASETREERAVAPELLAAPSQVNVNVPYFDPLTSQTVVLTTIYGGNAGLKNEVQRLRLLSAVASPLQRYSLQLGATYTVTDLENLIGALPAPSTAVMLAFPDRYIRDGSGQLITVDGRAVNFERQHSRQLRLNASASIPLARGMTGSGAARRPGGPPLLLQFNAAHTFTLESKTAIRPALGEVDLLAGGAIGIGGGQLRNVSDFSLTLTRGGTGLRASYRRRGESLLVFGTPASPSLLSFAPIAQFDLRGFVDIGALLPKSHLAKNTRFTVTFENLGNTRQTTSSSTGSVPLGFQPAYRDPIGRTVTFELRKQF